MSYEWSPANVKAFGALFRSLLPSGHLALEHSIGHLPCGEGGKDFQPGGVMADYDVVLSEFNRFPCGDEVWQIAARLLGPAYVRPPDQPKSDDPRPPWYLAPGTVRG